MKLGQEYFSLRREATMPTTPWCQPSLARTRALRSLWGRLFDLLDGLGADGLLHRLPLPVQGAQLPGQGLGPGRVRLLQQIRRQVRRPHAPGGVDPGSQDEADLDGGDGLALQPRLPQQGVDAHEVRVGQGLQPPANDDPVLPLHAHDVGHGADGGQGGVPGEEGVLLVHAPQGQHQLQRHAHAGQVLEGVEAVPPVGVHHRHGGRQLLLALVVVGDDHVHAQRVPAKSTSATPVMPQSTVTSSRAPRS